MDENQTRFQPFGVASRARPCRLAFLVNFENCPAELLDSLFKTNYDLWGGRFNPIIPVSKGTISEPFWSLLKCVDPDLVYTYTQLTQDTIDRIIQELIPWHIEAHPPRLLESDHPQFHPRVSEELVGSRDVLPLLMSRQNIFSFGQAPTLLTYFHEWKNPLNKDLAKLMERNFGIIHELAVPKIPDEWSTLKVRNDWTPWDLFSKIATTHSLLFPFQSSAAHASSPPCEHTAASEYCILIGDNTETWLYFWNRIFLIQKNCRIRWNTVCLPLVLFQHDNFVGPLREFLKRYVQRSGSHPSRVSVESFECSENELTDLKTQILNGLDVIPSSNKLRSGEFPTLSCSRSTLYLSWSELYQQATSSESLLNTPTSVLPLDRRIWAMDVRVQYIPRFGFYGNEVLWWTLPRRKDVTEAFFPGRRSRVDADYSISVEMRGQGPFMLRLPSESEIFHRAAGVTEINTYDANLGHIVRKPEFARFGKWDKGLYLDGILELFGGLESASRFFEHSYWRSIFERLSLGSPEKETGLFDSVRNGLNKKRTLIAEQLAKGNDKPIDWLSHFVIRRARDLQLRPEEASFSELESLFLEQREKFIATNPGFRTATSVDEIEEDRTKASEDLLQIVQWLTNSGVLQQGIRIRCTNCGSRFWREMGTIKQKVKCDGCTAVVPVPVESTWRYRLNSLIRNGIALHGCVPVISALRELRTQAKDSFIYTHGVGLFRNYTDQNPTAEMDLLCISDGKLVCGEVKSSSSEFTREELEKLAGIALDIKADEAVILGFNDPDGRMQKHGEVLAALLPAGCSVLICRPSPWSFEPQPHP
jgi:hypothetical protein